MPDVCQVDGIQPPKFTVIVHNGQESHLCGDHALKFAADNGGRIVNYGAKIIQEAKGLQGYDPIHTGEQGYWCAGCEEIHRYTSDPVEANLWLMSGDTIYLEERGEEAYSEVTAIPAYMCPEGNYTPAENFAKGEIIRCGNEDCGSEFVGENAKTEARNCCLWSWRHDNH